MNDFDYENMQKKATARGAFHKKNGSKSKGCHLPSDDLTPAQRKKLNGPCVTVKLGQPTTWAEFKSLRHDLQQTYYDQCFEYYGPSLSAFAKMLGVSEPSLTKYFKAHDLKVRSDVHYRMTKIQKEMWAAFCNGVVGGGEPHFRSSEEDATKLCNDTADKDKAAEQDNTINDIVQADALSEYCQLDAQVTDEFYKTRVDQLRFERDFYKERYFELLAILGEWRSK